MFPLKQTKYFCIIIGSTEKIFGCFFILDLCSYTTSNCVQLGFLNFPEGNLSLKCRSLFKYNEKLNSIKTLTLFVKYDRTKTRLKANPGMCLLHCMSTWFLLKNKDVFNLYWNCLTFSKSLTSLAEPTETRHDAI